MNKKQVESIGKFFWEIAKVLIAGGALAGMMMPNIPIVKVIGTVTMAFAFAVMAFIVEGIIDNDDEDPP